MQFLPLAGSRLISLVLLCSSFSVPAQTQWTSLAAAGPGARSDIALAYDGARDRVVLTGGWDGVANLADVWEFDGTAWSPRAAAGGPGPHSSHGLVYDPVRQRAVLFGGWNGTNLLDQTWEWDGAAGTWTQRTPAVRPPARYSHAMVYDASRQRVLLFGGYCGTGCALADTWEWDGANGTWTQRTPALAPTARFSAGLAYDGARQRAVLFGGRTLAARANDHWEWDGAAGTWTQRTGLGVVPSARSAHRLIYDAARQRCVLFGGFAGVFVNDTWEFDGNAWLARTPTTPPSARAFFGFEYDAQRRRGVLYGGDLGAGPAQGTALYAPRTPAQVASFGVGCPTVPPQLLDDGLPWVGRSFALELASLLPQAAAALLLGASNTAWSGGSLPFDLGAIGMTGCALRVSPDVVVGSVAIAGRARFVLAVPANSALVGAPLFAQGLAAEPGSNPLGVSASAGVQLLFGGL